MQLISFQFPEILQYAILGYVFWGDLRAMSTQMNVKFHDGKAPNKENNLLLDHRYMTPCDHELQRTLLVYLHFAIFCKPFSLFREWSPVYNLFQSFKFNDPTLATAIQVATTAAGSCHRQHPTPTATLPTFGPSTDSMVLTFFRRGHETAVLHSQQNIETVLELLKIIQEINVLRERNSLQNS